MSESTRRPPCGHEPVAGYDVSFDVADGEITSACDARVTLETVPLAEAERVGCGNEDCEYHHEAVAAALRRTARRHCGITI